MRDRQALQQHLLHHGKNSYIRSDAQRQSKNGNGGESGAVSQRPQTESQVLPNGVHAAVSPRIN
jgi:hypothetical protein